MLVSFEGIDGSGKSTVARRVAAILRREGTKVRIEREPTPTWIGRAVRDGIRARADPLALAFLFLADRAAHAKRLEPHVKGRNLVLLDRYVDSTIAYQGEALRGRISRPIATLRRQWALFPRPKLTLWLDVPPEVGLRRIQGRAVRESFGKLAFLRAVRANYARLARAEPRRFVRVDATGSAPTVAAACINELRRRRLLR